MAFQFWMMQLFMENKKINSRKNKKLVTKQKTANDLE